MVANAKMHDDEHETSVSLVRELLAAQFPDWAELSIEPVPSDGTVNALYRLGDEMVVRLPRIAAWAEDVDMLQRWLPRFAPLLPLAIPVPLAKGEPTDAYPLPWSVYTWLAGEQAAIEAIADPAAEAAVLARFVTALQQIDPDGGRPSGRGIPLARRDPEIRGRIDALRGMIDTEAVTSAWEHALRAPQWSGAPVWVHGDLLPGNLLVSDARLSAVIDFGVVGVGDPACDTMVAWSLLPAEARPIFRAGLQVDDATWARGRGWALSVALMALPYYLHTNPAFVRLSRHMIEEILIEHAAGHLTA